MNRFKYYSDLTLKKKVIDNGDGTGTKTAYNPDGTVKSVEALTDLPIPEPIEPTFEELFMEFLEALGGEDA